MSECELTIVLPVYNDQENLDRILGEFLANEPTQTWEVIVVDDGSPEPLQTTIKLPEHWKMLRNRNRQGAARSRNIGVDQAGGRYIAFISVFLKIPQDYVSRVFQFIESHNFDIAQHLLTRAPEITPSHFQSFLLEQKDRLPESRHNLPVNNTQFTAAILKREIFTEEGGFDENMQHYGGHELDLVYRLDKKGFTRRILITDLPLERIKVESHGSIRSRLQEYGSVGLPALLKKHPELKSTILVYPAFWFLLKIFGAPVCLEKRLRKKIEQNIILSNRMYRIYLHLLVRNAWESL